MIIFCNLLASPLWYFDNPVLITSLKKTHCVTLLRSSGIDDDHVLVVCFSSTHGFPKLSIIRSFFGRRPVGPYFKNKLRMYIVCKEFLVSQSSYAMYTIYFYQSLFFHASS